MSSTPNHVKKYSTAREFKKHKRAELRRGFAALDDFNFACAWIPIDSYRRWCNIRNELKLLQKELSAKEWGR